MRLPSHVWGFQTYRSLSHIGCRGAHTCKIRVNTVIDPPPTFLKQSLKSSSNLVFETRTIHTTSSLQQNGKKLSKMKVLYVPNPFRWIFNTLELSKLKHEWDPKFNTEEFKFGATQGICTISDLFHRREWGELRGLLTQAAIDALRTDKTTDIDQVNNTVITPDDVQVTQLNNVNLQTIVDNKYCDIDIGIIAVRQPYNPDKHAIIMLEYAARFHRNYTEGQLPEWTVTRFSLKRFQAIPK